MAARRSTRQRAGRASSRLRLCDASFKLTPCVSLQRCKELAGTHRVCIVASAVSQAPSFTLPRPYLHLCASQVTNLLGKAVDQALQDQPLEALDTIVEKHETVLGPTCCNSS